MALHKLVRPGDDDFDDVYSRPLSEDVLPKHRIPEGSADPSAVFYMLRDELALDGNSSQNLATFCTTWVDDEIRRLMDLTFDKNIVDKDEYPQTAQMESRCVSMLADLWHAPSGGDAVGTSTTGSSEAAMLGGMALKFRWRIRQKAAGRPTDRPNLVCGPVQVCWEKFARYFDVELRQVPLLPDANGLRPEQLRDHVDENTIGVVGILGVTYTCDFEPIAALAAELDAIEREHGWDVPIHVDAASGGFIAPFTQPDLLWDFRVPRVASINTSGHKFGLAPLGVGWVVWRQADRLPAELVFSVDYLGGNMPTFALNFSRPGGQIVSQYYLMLRLGRDGYRRVQQACLDTAQYLADRLSTMDAFTLLYSGRGGLPAVSYTLADPNSPWSLYDLSEHLRERGWQVPSYPLPPDRQETVIQRVLVRHGTGRDKIALLVDDIVRSVQRLDRGSRPSAGDDDRSRISFHH